MKEKMLDKNAIMGRISDLKTEIESQFCIRFCFLWNKIAWHIVISEDFLFMKTNILLPRMWIFTFLLFISWSGEFAVMSDYCVLQAEKDCRVWSITELDFPTNIEELRTACLHVNKVNRCVSNTLRNCTSYEADENRVVYGKLHVFLDDEASVRDSRRLKDMEGLLYMARDICDEKSVLHREIKPHFSCILSTMLTQFKEEECVYYELRAVSFLENRIERKAKMANENGNKIRNELKSCLRMLMNINCYITRTMRSCDTDLKQPLLEIFKEGGNLIFQCPDSIKIDAMELLDDLKLLTRQEIYIKELIQVDTLFYGCRSSEICFLRK